MRSSCSCRRISGSRAFGLSGKHLLRPFPQLKKALVLRQVKLGVTRSIRPQKINALDDHRNSVERSWLTGQFPGFEVSWSCREPVRTLCALSPAADKKSIRGWCPLRR